MRLQAGGTLRAESFYVRRPADDALLNSLLQGEFCYVLAPRQIGKSSLRTRTEERLEEKGVLCATVDLSNIGSSANAEDWYFGLCSEIWRQLSLTGKLNEWWSAELAPPVLRWSRFLEDKLLAERPERIVIFLDEIDVTLGLQISRDDFFSSIRSLYNARPDKPAFERLTFCLLGVASPDELVTTERITPFNIGCPISLEDFTEPEARAFIPCLSGDELQQTELLAAVLKWTNGHPFQTQRLCMALVDDVPQPFETPTARIKRLVEKIFWQEGGPKDSSLTYAEQRFRKERGDKRFLARAALYRRLLAGEMVREDRADRAQQELRLAGMASTRGGSLQIRNRIFANVFGTEWLSRQEESMNGEPRLISVQKTILARLMETAPLELAGMVTSGEMTADEQSASVDALVQRGWVMVVKDGTGLAFSADGKEQRCQHSLELFRFLLSGMILPTWIGRGDYDSRIDEDFVESLCRVHGVVLQQDDVLDAIKLLKWSPSALRFSVEPNRKPLVDAPLPDEAMLEMARNDFFGQLVQRLWQDYKQSELYSYFMETRGLREIEFQQEIIVKGEDGVRLRRKLRARGSIWRAGEEMGGGFARVSLRLNFPEPWEWPGLFPKQEKA